MYMDTKALEKQIYLTVKFCSLINIIKHLRPLQMTKAYSTMTNGNYEVGKSPNLSKEKPVETDLR